MARWMYIEKFGEEVFINEDHPLAIAQAALDAEAAKGDGGSKAYGSLKKGELLSIANERGIEGAANMTKPEIIEALEKHDAEQASE